MCREPKLKQNIRIDTGVQEGSEISMFYVPLISKLITWGKDRDEARKLLDAAIDQYVVRGVNHNAGFCKTICNHPQFMKGEYNTAFIPTYYKNGFVSEMMTPYDEKLIALSAYKMKQYNYQYQKLENVKTPCIDPKMHKMYYQIGENVYKICACPEQNFVKIEVVEGKCDATQLDTCKLNDFNVTHGKFIEMGLLNNKGEQEHKEIQYMETVNYMTYRMYDTSKNQK